MAHPDTLTEPPQSISAAELRRRLLASTPPPMGASAPVIDLDELTKAAAAPARPGPFSRLTMPGAHGPVSAGSLPPNLDPVVVPPPPSYPTSRHRMPGLDSHGPNQAPFVPNAIAAPEPDPSLTGPPKGAPTPEDYKRIRQENRELRKLLEEMKQLLQEASENEQVATTREQALQARLTESERLAADLTAQLQLIEEQVSSGALAPAPATPKTRDELEEWSDELEKESAGHQQMRRKLDEERKQLREDEEALEQQMRQMEVSMARERALIARQETELKRLSAEIQHELEIMQRGDASLRDQLSKFQRRAADVLQGKMNGPPGSNSGGGGKR